MQTECWTSYWDRIEFGQDRFDGVGEQCYMWGNQSVCERTDGFTSQ